MNDKIDELLTRGVDQILPSREEFEKILRSGKKITLYQGFDPTGAQLHVGHMIGLRKLKQFQELGHHVIFLIGSATVQAGDPSGKKTARERSHSLIVGSHEDKPGILRKIAEIFEIEGINMDSIDSFKSDEGVKFKITTRVAPKEKKDKLIKSLTAQGFFISDEFREYAKNYADQAGKIINLKGENAVEIRYNGDWLSKLSFTEILDITGHFSLQQLSERDLFQERIKKGETVSLREFLYPVLQAYDSVAMSVDLEIGGTDQMFNMLAGRTLVKTMQSRDKFVMTTPILADPQGNKIGKSEGNVIGLTDKPEDLFGKIMGLSDDVVTKGFEYLTDISMEQISKLAGQLIPIELKKKLAYEIVSQLNDEAQAKTAQEHFEKTVQKHELPEDMPTVNVNPDMHLEISELLVELGLAGSRSEAKRLVEQKSVLVNDELVEVPNQEIIPEDNMIIKAGKRNFVRIKVSDGK